MTERDLGNLSEMFKVSRRTPPEPAPSTESPASQSVGDTPTSSPVDREDTQHAAPEAAAKPVAKKASTRKAPPKKSATSAPATTKRAAAKRSALAKSGKGRPTTSGGGVEQPSAADSAAAQKKDPTTDHAESTARRAQIIIRIPTALFDTFKAAAEELNLSYGQLTLLSVEQHLDAIRTEFAARVPATSSLFSATAYKPQAQERGVPKTPVNLHMSAADLEVVEQLWRDLPGCRDRNDLLSTAVRMHLSPDPKV